jgi:hypothetical protein
LREYESYGWALPEQTFHQPLLLMGPPKPDAPAENVPIDELVFFGRLESRKGLWLFCEALDRIANKLRGRIVTFLGPVTYAYGISARRRLSSEARSGRFKYDF